MKKGYIFLLVLAIAIIFVSRVMGANNSRVNTNAQIAIDSIYHDGICDKEEKEKRDLEKRYSDFLTKKNNDRTAGDRLDAADYRLGECYDRSNNQAVSDSDKDGVPDTIDRCPNTKAGTAVDADGCPVKMQLSLGTDKSVYSPGETVVISGSVWDAKGGLDGAVVRVDAEGTKLNATAHSTAKYKGKYECKYPLPSDIAYGKHSIAATASYSGYTGTISKSTSFDVGKTKIEIEIEKIIPVPGEVPVTITALDQNGQPLKGVVTITVVDKNNKEIYFTELEKTPGYTLDDNGQYSTNLKTWNPGERQTWGSYTYLKDIPLTATIKVEIRDKENKIIQKEDETIPFNLALIHGVVVDNKSLKWINQNIEPTISVPSVMHFKEENGENGNFWVMVKPYNFTRRKSIEKMMEGGWDVALSWSTISTYPLIYSIENPPKAGEVLELGKVSKTPLESILKWYVNFGLTPHTWPDGTTDTKPLTGPFANGVTNNFRDALGNAEASKFNCVSMQYKTLWFLNHLKNKKAADDNAKFLTTLKGWHYSAVYGVAAPIYPEHNAVALWERVKNPIINNEIYGPLTHAKILDPHGKQKPYWYTADTVLFEWHPDESTEKNYVAIGWKPPWPKPNSKPEKSKYELVGVNCPVDLLVINSGGQRLGILPNGNKIAEFKPIDSYFLQDKKGDKQWFFALPQDTYTISITGTDPGNFHLLAYTPGKDVHDYGENPVTAGEQATLTMNPETGDKLTLANGKEVYPSSVSPKNLTCPISHQKAYDLYTSNYDQLQKLMKQGKGDVPEAQDFYKKYKFYRDCYNQKQQIKTLYPIADAYVYAYNYRNWNRANWGGYDQIRAGWHPTGGESRAYIKFDLSNLDPSKVSNAALKLYHFQTAGSNHVDIGIYRVTGPWNEGTDTYHSGSTERTAGPGELSWSQQPPIDTQPILSFNPGRGLGDWVEVDITPLVKQWLTGTANYGLVIKSIGHLTQSTPASVYHFASRERKADLDNPKGEDKAPMLILSENPNGGNAITQPAPQHHATQPTKNTFSCTNKENEEKGCCCFKGAHTYRFGSRYVTNVLARFDTGRGFDCRCTVNLDVDRGNGWETVKTVQANSSRGASEVAPTDVVVPVNGTIAGFRISDGCACCIDSSKITLNADYPGGGLPQQPGVPGKDIAIKGSDRPWVIGSHNGIHHGTGSGWVPQPGGGRGNDIAIDGSDRPWIIGSDNGIYYNDGNKWVQYPGGGKGLAIAVAADGTPWVIGSDNGIHHGTGSGWAEQPGGGKGKDIAIDGSGRPWVIGSDNGIYYHDGNRWVQYPGGGKGLAIAVASDGTPWVIGSDNGIHHGTGSGWAEQPGGGRGKDIAIDGNGRPWVIGSDDGIYYYDGNRWVQYPGVGRGHRLSVCP